WDMETLMPPRGISLRSLELAQMSQLRHRMITNPKIAALIKKIAEDNKCDSLNMAQKRNVFLLKKEYDEAASLPEQLVVETARQRAITINAWKKAKAAENFQLFKPDLEKLVELRRKAADLLMDVKGVATRYDALIDIFEPKITAEVISKTFTDLKDGLMPILQKCTSSHKQPNTSILRRKVPINIQKKISLLLTSFLGYDINSKNAGGRIDETEHPFTTGYYDDVRITTHYYENRFESSIFSILHEAGHALYEQNLNLEWMYLPIGSACSLGLHESQSRFVENIIGRSTEFWTYFFPKLKNLARKALYDVALDELVLAVNKVQPSKIRIESDEVTYCLHIIIRFEIEKDMMADRLSVTDLPEEWNRKYEKYLGVEIKNDSEGVMQDTHWASGVYGYFPTYALGNIYSGQILAAMEKDIPSWRDQISKGVFQEAKSWLIKNVYHYGNLYDPSDLMKKITGEGINIQHYLNYLERKYSNLYEY
ncbi:MAG: carboxypeptidase M32, partial [Candidatus Bathyarchaeota archaeon]